MTADSDETAAGAAAPGRPNKSQQKRDTAALRALVEALLALPAGALQAAPVDEAVREALEAARRMRRAALARQLGYVTGLMRKQDAAAVARYLDTCAQPHRREVRAFQQVEQWRDALLAGDERAFAEVVARRGADRQRLEQLLRAARAEHAAGRPPKATRQLFRYLAGLHAGGAAENDD